MLALTQQGRSRLRTSGPRAMRMASGGEQYWRLHAYARASSTSLSKELAKPSSGECV